MPLMNMLPMVSHATSSTFGPYAQLGSDVHQFITNLEARVSKISDLAIIELVCLRRQYYQQFNSKLLKWPQLSVLGIYEVQEWIYMFLKAADRAGGVVSSNHMYRQKFTKLLVAKIEEAATISDEPDIYDPLIEFCADSQSITDHSDLELSQKTFWIDYTPPFRPTSLSVSDPHIKILEQPHLVSSLGSTGYRTWEASLHLAYYVSLEWPTHISGKKVLELGAGTGLVSLHIAQFCGPRQVIATDGDYHLVQRLGKSVEVNDGCSNLHSRDYMTTQVYQWGDAFPSSFWDPKTGLFDVDNAFAADVTFDPEIVPLLVDALKDLFSYKNFQKAWVCSTIRNQSTFDGFLALCEKSYLHCEILDTRKVLTGYQFGFFHSSTIPIVVVLVTRSDKWDTFITE